MTTDTLATRTPDPVYSPAHYTHPSGVECKDIAKHLSFALGNALKYVWRAGRKDYNAMQDLEKALECIEIELSLVDDRIYLNDDKIRKNLERVLAVETNYFKSKAFENLALANCFDDDSRRHRLEGAKLYIIDMMI
jgi:hypothetical protein